MNARRFIVRGRVQGVGFRWFAVRAARRRAVAGWVRNLPDGSVEVVASGDSAGIQGLREDLHRGPSASSVREVEEGPAGEGEIPPEDSGFDVRY